MRKHSLLSTVPLLVSLSVGGGRVVPPLIRTECTLEEEVVRIHTFITMCSESHLLGHKMYFHTNKLCSLALQQNGAHKASVNTSSPPLHSPLFSDVHKALHLFSALMDAHHHFPHTLVERSQDISQTVHVCLVSYSRVY